MVWGARGDVRGRVENGRVRHRAIVERLYDSLREESRTLREGTGDSMEMLAQFEEIRDAARNLRPGRLTVVYEQRNENFEG